MPKRFNIVLVSSTQRFSSPWLALKPLQNICNAITLTVGATNAHKLTRYCILCWP